MDLPMGLNLDKLCVCEPSHSDAFYGTAVMPSHDCIACYQHASGRHLRNKAQVYCFSAFSRRPSPILSPVICF